MTNENDFYDRMFANDGILGACHYPEAARLVPESCEALAGPRPLALAKELTNTADITFHVCCMISDQNLPKIDVKIGRLRVLGLRIRDPAGNEHIVAVAHPVGHPVGKSANRVLLRSHNPGRGYPLPKPTPVADDEDTILAPTDEISAAVEREMEAPPHGPDPVVVETEDYRTNDNGPENVPTPPFAL